MKERDVNARDEDGYTDLYYAIDNGDIEAAKELIEAGADLNIDYSDDNETAIYLAAKWQRKEILKLLLENPTTEVNHVNYNGDTALYIAAKWGHQEVLELLLNDHRIDINHLNNDRHTALEIAAHNGHQKTVESLIKAGADPNIIGRYNSAAVFYPHYFNDKAIIKLFKQAIDKDDHKTIKNLLKHNSGLKDMSIGNPQETILSYAISKNKGKIERYLKKQGFIEEDKDGNSFLHHTIIKNDVTTTRELIETGVDINIKNNTGQTPLHIAANNGNSEIAFFLLESGADLTIKDESGQTPIDYNPRLFADISMNDVNIIVGPRISHDKKAIQESYEAAGLSLGIYGDRINPVDIKRLSFTKGSRIIINAHGARSDAKHQIQLYSSFGYEHATDYTLYSFQALANSSRQKSINVELFSCYGGNAIYDIAYLPKDSTLMTFTDEYRFSLVSIDNELIAQSAAFIEPHNQFTRFAAYLVKHPDDTYFAINTDIPIENGRIFRTDIDSLESFLDIDIKAWQRQQILNFSAFLELHKAYTSKGNQDKINQFQALASNDLELTNFIDKLYPEHYREMLFINSAANNNKSTVSKFLKDQEELDMNFKLQTGITALYIPVLQGNEEMVKLILANSRANLNTICDNDGNTPLRIALQQNNKEIVMLLLNDPRTDVNQVINDYGDTVLYSAAQDNNKEIIKLLLDNPRTDINKVNKYGGSAISIALRVRNKEIVTLLLLDPRIDLNQAMDGGVSSLFYYAADIGNEEIVKLLLNDPRVDINKAKDNDSTPLSIAIWKNNEEIVKLLLADSRIEVSANNILSTAIFVSNEEVIKLLLADSRTDVNQIGSDGYTALASAIEIRSDQEIIDSLLKAGADPNVKCKYGVVVDLKPEYFNDEAITKLFKEAIDDGDTKTIGNLLKYHAKFKDMTIGDSRETLLSYALSNNKPEMVSYMKELGFKPKVGKLDVVMQIDGIAQVMMRANEFLKKHDPLRIPGGAEAAEISRVSSTISLPSPQSEIVPDAPPVTQTLPEFSTQMALGAVLYKIGSDVYNLAQGYLNKAPSPITTSKELEELNLKLHKRLVSSRI